MPPHSKVVSGVPSAPRVREFRTRWLPTIVTVIGLTLPVGAIVLKTTLDDAQVKREAEHSTASTRITTDDIERSTNDFCGDNGTTAPIHSSVLADQAQKWAEHTAARDDFSHGPLTPYVSEFEAKMTPSDTIFNGAPANAEDIITSLDNSVTGYAENQLYPYHTDIGIGVAYDSKSDIWVVQRCGAPAAYSEDLKDAIGG